MEGGGKEKDQLSVKVYAREGKDKNIIGHVLAHHCKNLAKCC